MTTPPKWVNVGFYPEDYNPKVHGPFVPARYYGKPDINFWDLKLSEIPAWIGRRNKHPITIGRACGRFWWRWQMKWMLPKYASLAGLSQFAFFGSLIFFINNYDHLKKESQKYGYH